MKIIVILSLFFIPFITSSQIDFENPPWEIGCDSMQTQMDMNICSGNSYMIADSLLTQTYNAFILSLENRHKEELTNPITEGK